MDALTLLLAAALASGCIAALRALRRRPGRRDTASRIDFDLHKSREQNLRGLAGRHF